MTETVRLVLPNPLHSAYKNVAFNPPEGFSYVAEHHDVMERSSSGSVQAGTRLLYDEGWLNSALIFLRDSFLLARERVTSLTKSSGACLVFSLTRYTAFTQVPTILYQEYVPPWAATGRAMQRTLYMQKSIKRILASTPTYVSTYLSIMSEKEVEERVDSLIIGVPLPPAFVRPESDESNLLFVSSGNYAQDEGYAYAAFATRGGIDVLRSFRILNRQYGDKVRLTMRSYIPKEVKQEFADVLKLPNVTVHEEVLPRSKLQEVYAGSDIFLFPAYRGITMTIGEAFGYGLPVVGADSWDMPDIVTDKVNGLLRTRDDRGTPLIRNHVPFWDFRVLVRAPADEDFLKSYTEAVSSLIDRRSYRRQLGSNAVRTVTDGHLSLPHMRQRLGRFFEEALARR
jgi:glycosyltransferase involved in cell wall biosynthesis